MAWTALILLLVAALPAVVTLLPPGPRRPATGLDQLAAGAQLVLLGASAACAAGVSASGVSTPTLLGVLAACLGVAVAGPGGAGPTMVILDLAARRDQPRGGDHDAAPDEQALRGGTWIGVLERIAVAATLLAGWPEGLAVVLAVKGLARYSELRRPNGAAERFIIGTFASVLWAAACAGVAHLILSAAG